MFGVHVVVYLCREGIAGDGWGGSGGVLVGSLNRRLTYSGGGGDDDETHTGGVVAEEESAEEEKEGQDKQHEEHAVEDDERRKLMSPSEFLQYSAPKGIYFL